MKKHVLLLIATAYLTSCVALPETGQRKFIVTSVAQENEMGEQGYKEVISKSKLANKSPNYQVLQRVGSRIAAATGQKFNWEYNLIEDKQLNAWCMPGGKIAVYTGILPFMKNEAGMAAVLGHEVAHATLRHSGQRITQEKGTQFALSIGGALLGNAQYKNELMALMGAGATVGILLPYGREHETEADLIGLRYMAEAGYDPQEAIEFWKRFSAVTANGAPPEFLSTHPGGTTRINDLKRHMKEAQKIYSTAANKYGAGSNL